MVINVFLGNKFLSLRKRPMVLLFSFKDIYDALKKLIGSLR